MFTGIIKEIGIVRESIREAGKVILGIKSEKVINELDIGASVSIDGACQTVVKISGNMFYVEAVQETLKKTTLGSLNVGNRVNLESSVTISEGLGGHIVLGHIDGIGTITEIKNLDGSKIYSICVPENISEYFVEVGSIAVDGISLTIAELRENIVEISIIPFTEKNTTIGEKKIGDKVNIEVDIIGKYVKRFLEKREKIEKITTEWLKSVGFL